jgi:hypothetical protein
MQFDRSKHMEKKKGGQQQKGDSLPTRNPQPAQPQQGSLFSSSF